MFYNFTTKNLSFTFLQLAIQTNLTLTLLTGFVIQMHSSSLLAILCKSHGLHPPIMWNAKIQWSLSVCQSLSVIQLRSLGFGPATHLCVRQSMPDNGFCLTILRTCPHCHHVPAVKNIQLTIGIILTYWTFLSTACSHQFTSTCENLLCTVAVTP